MEPSKKKPIPEDENPMADYNPQNRTFDAPVASSQEQEEEEEDEFDDYEELDESGED